MGLKYDTPAPVELHIEELRLEGFSAGDGVRIGDVVQHELARIIAEHGWQGLSNDSVVLETIHAGSFHVEREARAPAIGTRIAHAVHEGLARTRQSAAPAHDRGQGF